MAASSFSTSPLNFYKEFQPRFILSMRKQFPNVREEEIEDLYQDTFMTVVCQFNEGKTKEGTDWWAYIRKVGFNQMSKKLRGAGAAICVSIDANTDDNEVSPYMLEMELMKNASAEDEACLIAKEEKYVRIENVLASLPEKTSGLINDKYYHNLSDKEIAEKWGYANASTVKAKRFQIMKKVKELCSVGAA